EGSASAAAIAVAEMACFIRLSLGDLFDLVTLIPAGRRADNAACTVPGREMRTGRGDRGRGCRAEIPFAHARGWRAPATRRHPGRTSPQSQPFCGTPGRTQSIS